MLTVISLFTPLAACMNVSSITNYGGRERERERERGGSDRGSLWKNKHKYGIAVDVCLTSGACSNIELRSPKPRPPANSPKIFLNSSSGSTVAPPLQYCCCPAPLAPGPAEPYVSYCFLFSSSLRVYSFRTA